MAKHGLIGDEGVERRIIKVFEMSDCVHVTSEARAFRLVRSGFGR
jgi:hypothetical protein